MLSHVTPDRDDERRASALEVKHPITGRSTSIARVSLVFLIFVLVFVLAVPSSAAASDGEANVTVGIDAEEFVTDHKWEVSLPEKDEVDGENVTHVVLNYTGTGANVTTIYDHSNNIGYHVEFEDDDPIVDDGDDEVLNFSTKDDSKIHEGEEYDVWLHGIENPPNGSHEVSIEFHNGSDVFYEATETVETISADGSVDRPIEDETSDYRLFRSVDDETTPGVIEEVRVDYSDAVEGGGQIAHVSHWNLRISEVDDDDTIVGGDVYTDSGHEELVLRPHQEQAVEAGDDLVLALEDGVVNPGAGSYDVTVTLKGEDGVEEFVGTVDVYERETLEGTVTDEDGSGIEGATVAAVNDSSIDPFLFHDDAVAEATTDDDGSYSLTLPDSDLVDRVEVERTHYSSAKNSTPYQHVSEGLDFELEPLV